jgi:hypothetical protein
MKRYTGQQALYEAISRSRAKAKRGNILDRFLPEVSRQEKPALQEGQQAPVEPVQVPAESQPPVVPVAEQPPRPLPEKPREPVIVKEDTKLRRLAPVEVPEVPPEKAVPPTVNKSRPVERVDRPVPRLDPVRAWLRLKPVQLNAGRIEISVPYHISIVVALVVILVILAAFRIGQRYPGAKARSAVTTKAPAAVAPQNATTETPAAKTPQQADASVTPLLPSSSEPPKKEGDNWIVLAKHKNKADLQPVVDYFGQNGVALAIVHLPEARKVFAERKLNVAALPKGDDFLLVTNEFYNNPQSPGTDGYAERQRIIELGKNYKAPKGRESFATHFRDAYGMKITK